MTEAGFSGLWLSTQETAGRLHCSLQAARKVAKAAGIRRQVLPGLKPRYYAPDVDRVAASMVQNGAFDSEMAAAGKRIQAARIAAKANGPTTPKPGNAPTTAPDAATTRTAKSTPRAANGPTTPHGKPAKPKPTTTRRSRAAKGDT